MLSNFFDNFIAVDKDSLRCNSPVGDMSPTIVKETGCTKTVMVKTLGIAPEDLNVELKNF